MRFAIVFGLVALAACGASSDVSRSLGARCDSSSECDGRCLPPSNNYPDGFCTVVCNTTSECPDPSVCIDDDGGSCLFDCIDDMSCAFLGVAWRCVERDLRGQPGMKALVCRG